MDSETIRAFLANRAFVYQLFHRIFAEEPDGQLLEVLADRRTGEQLGHAVGAEAGSAFLDPLSGIAPDAFPEH
ncbi:MAG: hypothetical protein LBB46_02240, partial [Coriobacteriaceae bacterium]|nr:hypothetical protein [Coriobacteriaceae bacterium]